MISRLGLRISAAFRAVVPDPFVLAILLTFVAFVLAITTTPTSASQLVDAWSGLGEGDGLWALLKFAMQMSLILVTGHALASSPPMERVLVRLANIPKTGGQAVALVAGCAMVLALLNWGLGLIAGAILARRVGEAMRRKGVKVHYPLVAAAGYVGLLVWHGGFSGSAPLKVTQTDQITEIFGDSAPFTAIDLTQTILSPLNLIVSSGLLVIVPIVFMLLCPKNPEDFRPIEACVPLDEAPATDKPDDHKPWLPRLLEDSPIVTIMLVLLIAWWAKRFYLPVMEDGSLGRSGLFGLTPDSVNLTMLLLGLILHGTPMRYARAVEDATRGCAGIILQFPLYAGILAILQQSGMAEQLAAWIAARTDATTLPLFTFLSAGLVNLFVPSGGGQWAIQGPISMNAAVDAGVAPGKMVMAIAYGDELTNMLQPFWALPLLAITGVRARDIVGYTAIVMVVAAIWMGFWLLVL
jgi:short-chain fatty acids transporter